MGTTFDTFGDFLEHHGIKGMRWGVRREDGPDGTVSSNPSVKTETSSTHHPGSSSGTKHLSNQELQEIVTRMRLEKDFASLTGENQKKADSFIKGLLKESGKKQIRNIANIGTDIAVEQALSALGKKSGNVHVSEVATRLGKKNRGKK